MEFGYKEFSRSICWFWEVGSLRKRIFLDVSGLILFIEVCLFVDWLVF